MLDIYLNDNNNTVKPVNEKRKPFSKKEIFRIAVSILIVVLVLIAGNKIIKKISGNDAANTSNMDNVENNTGNETPSGQQPEAETPAGEGEKQPEISDSTDMYFNEKLLNDVGYTGNKAERDSDIYVEGKNSLVVANEGEEKIKALFAVVNFKDEKFNYLLKKQTGIAAKMKSESDVTAQIVLEAYKDGAVTSNFHTLAEVYDDMWSQFTIPINVTDADSLNIYIEYEGKNKIWIDAVYIDVIK